ncbi:MAG TPA: alanine racemase [Flavobacteriales bacterium]|nr:alanine racemase [Flavobacteriales bacterium]
MLYMLTVPTLILDVEKCKSNIAAMAENARRNNVLFRPHFKTHQSHEIGRWFREVGVTCITVSSLEMANHFAKDKWGDITVAFPVNILEIDKINTLASSISLNLLVESQKTIGQLSKTLTSPIGVFIKIDIGYHRTGVNPESTELISQILDEIDNSKLIKFRGFLGHAGHSYSARGIDEISAIHTGSIQIITGVKEHFTDRYPELIVSVGDTPTCSTMQDFGSVDEIRPGNFVFYDLSQVAIGSCTQEQISVAVACPVVSIHKDRSEIIIYGGGVHFSKERLEHPVYGGIYGQVVEGRSAGWGNIIAGVYVSKLSQEHGTISAPSAYIEAIQVGDLVKILPVHSCMTANLLKKYVTTEGELLK